MWHIKFSFTESLIKKPYIDWGNQLLLPHLKQRSMVSSHCNSQGTCNTNSVDDMSPHCELDVFLARYVTLWVCSGAGNSGNVFVRHRGLAIPISITVRAWRTCHEACRDRQLAVSLEVGNGENVFNFPCACANRKCTYLIRGPLVDDVSWQRIVLVDD